MPGLVSLITDFGTRDAYVGLMKGAMKRVSPELEFIDLSHEIPRHDVSAGAFWLERSFQYFPPNTVHLAVVDPGVGTQRHAIALQTMGHFFVGPDNGLFTDLLNRAAEEGSPLHCVELEDDAFRHLIPPACGNTFHGRDLFAPAAALLAERKDLSLLGPSYSPEQLHRRAQTSTPGMVEIRVIDHFGNLITDAKLSPESQPQVSIGEARARWVSTYDEGHPGELLALYGSFGTLELAVSGGSAKSETDARCGDQVKLG